MVKMKGKDFENMMVILARMNAECSRFKLTSARVPNLVIDVTVGGEEYTPVCIDDLFQEYFDGTLSIQNAAEEVVRRVLASKPKHKDKHHVVKTSTIIGILEVIMEDEYDGVSKDDYEYDDEEDEFTDDYDDEEDEYEDGEFEDEEEDEEDEEDEKPEPEPQPQPKSEPQPEPEVKKLGFADVIAAAGLSLDGDDDEEDGFDL